MGIVYRALDLKLERKVALKILLPDVVKNEVRKRRFIEEAKLASALKHPNIAVIYEIDTIAIRAGKLEPVQVKVPLRPRERCRR